MRGTLLGALLSTLLVTRIFSDTCTWNNCNEWDNDPTVINVHVVPHTHDDMGWKKTADDYYTGAHPPGTAEVIYPGVQYVINTVLNELSKDPTRRFSYCETGYLTRWLEEPTQLRNPKQVQKLKNFVTNGQLELIGGGWVQPDEATSHYTDLIDQYTLGLTKLQETFNSSCAKPKVSWQIDPFGHSREHGNLAAMIGYEGLFFAREHYLEHTYRVHNKTLEFQWKVSEDLDNTITTGAFYNMYYPPSQFNWDVVDIATNPIIDDKKLKGYNLDWYLWDPIMGFVPYIIFQRLPSQAHNHVLLLMGSDFLYSNANMWFTNMDKLIKHVNAQSPYKIKMFYSTPTCYLQAVNKWFTKNGTSMTSKKGQDFFPYAYNNNFLGGAHSYWSGFYTSKPAFKGLVRESSALLQLIRKINAISLDENVIDQNLKIQKLERAVALSQHHDAITGTSKDAVTKDYIRRLLRGWDAGETSLNNALTLLSPSGKNMQNLKICRQMNETDCHDELMGNQKIAITVFNGHIQPVESLIRLPYYNNTLHNDLAAVSLYDSNGNAVYNKVFSTFNNTDFFNHNPQLNNSNSAPYEIYFKANVGALGYNTYFLDLSTPVNPPTLAAPSTTKISHALQDDTSETTIQNDHIRLYFDKNGKLYQYEDLNVHMNYSFQQDFLFYEGYGFILPVTNEQQSSGAYVFRPANNTPQSIAGSKINIQVMRSKDVQEVRQIFSNWASQSIRLIQGKDKPYAEFEWTVGPVPTGSSKEVITRYTSSNLNNSGVFQTDSNGRQMITRKLNYNDDYTYVPTEPVASNYYPVNTRILINDPSKNLSFAVLTDRSQGGSSLNNGEIELMLHRRDFFDDGYGVNEALNELGTDGRGLVVRGKHWVFFGSSDIAVLQHRTLAMEMYNTPFVGLSQYDSIDNYTKNYATSLTGISMAQNLSANLLTLKQLDPETILLRLEHVFQKNENLMYSNQPAIVDLSTLFPKLTVNKVQEMNLVATEAVNSTVSNMIVTLAPMQIKTFLLNVSKKN